MGKLTLSDKFFVEGKELEDFENILKQIDDSTEFLRISGGNIGFAYYLNASFMKEAYKVLLITQKELLSFEDCSPQIPDLVIKLLRAPPEM